MTGPNLPGPMTAMEVSLSADYYLYSNSQSDGYSQSEFPLRPLRGASAGVPGGEHPSLIGVDLYHRRPSTATTHTTTSPSTAQSPPYTLLQPSQRPCLQPCRSSTVRPEMQLGVFESDRSGWWWHRDLSSTADPFQESSVSDPRSTDSAESVHLNPNYQLMVQGLGHTARREECNSQVDEHGFMVSPYLSAGGDLLIPPAKPPRDSMSEIADCCQYQTEDRSELSLLLSDGLIVEHGSDSSFGSDQWTDGRSPLLQAACVGSTAASKPLGGTESGSNQSSFINLLQDFACPSNVWIQCPAGSPLSRLEELTPLGVVDPAGAPDHNQTQSQSQSDDLLNPLLHHTFWPVPPRTDIRTDHDPCSLLSPCSPIRAEEERLSSRFPLKVATSLSTDCSPRQWEPSYEYMSYTTSTPSQPSFPDPGHSRSINPASSPLSTPSSPFRRPRSSPKRIGLSLYTKMSSSSRESGMIEQDQKALPVKRSRGRRPLISPDFGLALPDGKLTIGLQAVPGGQAFDPNLNPDAEMVKYCEVTKTGKKKKIFICQTTGCGKCFKRSEHLKRHVRSIHTNEKPYVCPWSSCVKSFSRHDNLNQHLKVHRLDQGGEVLNGLHISSEGVLRSDVDESPIDPIPLGLNRVELTDKSILSNF